MVGDVWARLPGTPVRSLGLIPVQAHRRPCRTGERVSDVQGGTNQGRAALEMLRSGLSPGLDGPASQLHQEPTAKVPPELAALSREGPRRQSCASSSTVSVLPIGRTTIS